MARLELPVMNTSLRAPAASASSAAYWMSGLSTIGSISLGLALVAGRKRVPRPATGNTAVLISCATIRISSQVMPDDKKPLTTGPLSAGPDRRVAPASTHGLHAGAHRH